MIKIDGLLWFIGALLICGAHALHLRGWRRERRAHLAWWKSHDERSQQRHEEFMRVMDDRDEAAGQNSERGQQ